jgi:hypothetical protein
MILTATAINDIDDITVKLQEFCQHQYTEFNAMFDSPALYEEVLNENVIVDMVKKVIAWLREFAQKVIALFKRAWAFITGKVKPTIAAAQANAADPKFFRIVDGPLWKAAGDKSAIDGMTCGELLMQSGFTHPTDTAPRKIHLCPGTELAKGIVGELEASYSKMHSERIREVISQARGLPRFGRGPSPYTKQQQQEHDILGRTQQRGGYTWDAVKENGYDSWYLGPMVEATISSLWYKGALEKMSLIEKDAKALGEHRPGETIVRHFDDLQKMLGREFLRMPQDGKQALINELRENGNFIVQFHNGLVNGTIAAFRNMSIFTMTCLHSVEAERVKNALAVDTSAQRRPDGPQLALPYRESAEYITEGLSSFVKNMATGDIEGDIDEIEKEVNDIHTPEQQRFVVTKIVRLLERLIMLRHNPGAVAKFVHDRLSWFERVLGDKGGNAGKEMAARVGENIARLAKIRDKALSKRWNDDTFNQQVDQLKDKVKELVDKAASSSVDSLD